VIYQFEKYSPRPTKATHELRQRCGNSRLKVALARHGQALRNVIEQNDGCVFKTVGDAFCAACRSPAIRGHEKTLCIAAEQPVLFIYNRRRT
jgi:class 3 adenylate cyclase